MSVETNSQSVIKNIAQESLETFQMVSAEAQRNQNIRLSTDVLANNLNNMSGQNKSANSISKKNSENLTKLKALFREPAIARIVVKTEDDDVETYFISRATPIKVPNSHAKFVSYDAPLGRLAATPAGDEVTIKLPNEFKSYEVLERTLLHPRLDSEWDSFDNTVESDAFGVFTVSSFRALLSEGILSAEPDDLLNLLLNAEAMGDAVSEGRRRRVIEQMQLRDQPVLDKYQDEIFRMPLDSQMLLVGPPGTGKTTTLIRRLGQKLNSTFFLDEEKDLLDSVMSPSMLPHEQSWVMYSPTQLLKLYVKEAFNREGIPASEDRIKTWYDTRRHLAREKMGILKSVNGGLFTFSDDNSNLQEAAIKDTIGWFEDFEDFVLTDVLSKLVAAVNWLEKNDSKENALILKKAKSALNIKEGANKSSVSKINDSIIYALFRLGTEVSTILKSFREELNVIIDNWVNIELRKDKSFLNDLSQFIDTLQEDFTEDTDDSDEDDDEIEDDDEQPVQASGTKIKKAHREYTASIRALAKAKYSKRQLKQTRKSARIISWLGDRIPTNDELVELGNKLTIQAKLRQLANPIKLYLGKIPSQYQSYKRARIKENSWYHFDDKAELLLRKKTLNGLEVDIILLLMLRHSRSLIARFTQNDLDTNAKLSILNSIISEYRLQVLVDEATDFSPVQLACMMELAHPKVRSFFACGDINQRVTPWGIRDKKHMAWVSKQIEIRPMTIAYRQSQLLTTLAGKISQLDGCDAEDIRLPELVDNKGEHPVLAEHLSGEALAVWLADRIAEIESNIGKLPSIAIFVDSESDVEPLTNALKLAIGDQNIQVVSCLQGRDIGQDADVRVFDVQHIKGLEFEAVFFVNIDKLAVKYPELFSKYLYVGTTRAATYLGLTCEKTLPNSMNDLSDLFISNWA